MSSHGATEHEAFVSLVPCEDIERYADQDGAVMLAVLDDFDAWGALPSASGDGVLIVRSTTFHSSPMKRATAATDSEPGMPKGVANLFPSFNERNVEQRPIVLPRGRQLDSVLVDAGEMPRMSTGAYPESGATSKLPEYRGLLAFTSPAYSRDGRHAFLRCRFGPTVKGASAMCLLERRGQGGEGDWVVVWKSFLYLA